MNTQMISKEGTECLWNEETKPAVDKWSVADVLNWAENFCPVKALNMLKKCNIDGEVLLVITEEDIRLLCDNGDYDMSFVDKKKCWLAIHALQAVAFGKFFGLATDAQRKFGVAQVPQHHQTCVNTFSGSPFPEPVLNQIRRNEDCDVSPPTSINGCATNIPTEFFKTAISLGYSFLVTWITSFVMVIVHERVPDMKRYPPLPDIFLDNVPHIPWAFHMCEITGTLLFTIWSCVCIFHKYRMVLLRRFFALAGTVFLLRCVTMLITSLSVPGTHLQCNQSDYAIDDTGLDIGEALALRISRAYFIWSGLGMSIQGVRTCGDYMFSGHTVALTLLNFFITEYTPRNLYFLHTLSWLLNMFGIFFILAAHEHYSIDVFVAFYITSRLFLYYHTLANNRALMSNDSNRTRIWFPMFSYFESCVDGIIPNEFDSVGILIKNFIDLVLSLKDSIMNTVSKMWIKNPKVKHTTNNSFFKPNVIPSEKCNVATSTNTSGCNTPTSKSSLTSFNNVEQLAERVKID